MWENGAVFKHTQANAANTVDLTDIPVEAVNVLPKYNHKGIWRQYKGVGRIV